MKVNPNGIDNQKYEPTKNSAGSRPDHDTCLFTESGATTASPQSTPNTPNPYIDISNHQFTNIELGWEAILSILLCNKTYQNKTPPILC